MPHNDHYPRTAKYHQASLSAWPEKPELVEFLECDPCPVAIIGLNVFEKVATEAPPLIYGNKKLWTSASLKSAISWAVTSSSPDAEDACENGFWRGLRDRPRSQQGAHPETYIFERHVWTINSIRDEWLVVRGLPLPSVREKEDLGTLMSSQSLDGASSKNRDTRGVRCFMSEPLTSHQVFVRNFDWSMTSLGRMDEWDPQLLDILSLILTDTNPACVFWGLEMTSIYNEAFITIAGQKHPTMMGDSPANAFVEVWDDFFEPRIQLSRQTKQPFSEKALPLILERNAYPEETFMDFTFLPLLGFSGEVVGFYHTVTEVTQQVLSKRRMSLLLHVSEVLSNAQNLNMFWRLLINSLSDAKLDIPFAALYSVSSAIQHASFAQEQHESNEVSETCHFEGCLGYTYEDQNLPSMFSLAAEDSTLAPLFRASLQSRGTTVLRSSEGSLPEILVEHVNTEKQGNENTTVVICPLQPTNHEAALGFLSLGLSFCRPYDSDYQSFINLFIKNICSSLASVVLLEDEKNRGLNAAERAAYESAQLTMKLEERELESQIQEHKFMTMMQQVPVGILDLTPDGSILFGNQAWYGMTLCDRLHKDMNSWLHVVHKDDHDLWRAEWTTVSSQLQSVSFEMRLTIPWRNLNLEHEDIHLEYTWVLVRMSPMLADNDHTANITASFTDISFQKYTIVQQVRLAEDAVEAKRQQDNFIDMTSHEMRNPLNAMLLCAQELCLGLESMKAHSIDHVQQDILHSSLDAADTIVYCGRHQLRIIDDVLTLSKLDARLLRIHPIQVNPVSMVREMMKLFDREIQAQGIAMQLKVEDSMNNERFERMMLDPSRAVQILVNFIANAIKFTKTEKLRELWVEMRASEEEPSESSLVGKNIKLVPQSDFYQDPAKSKSWGKEKPIYLEFLVRDTGPGISEVDILQLFHRFTQSRPKTHAHYGGSGLGLFISQRLAELQGGRVGVASTLGAGSSFYFYVKVQQVTRAADVTTQADLNVVHQPRERVNANLDIPTRGQTEAKGISVLIVEDNLVNQKVLKRQLDRLGYITSVANHGIEALDQIHKSTLWKGSGRSPDEGAPLHAILMDIEMPMMDGRECIKQIRKYEDQNLISIHVPVIALTANARVEQIEDAMKCGFDDVITKPFQIKQVTDRIILLLNKEIVE